MTENNSEGYFTKVLNDLLVATEQITERMEEGLTAMWTIGGKQQQQQQQQSNDGDDASGDDKAENKVLDPEDQKEWESLLQEDEDDYEIHSPLQGITEEVLSNLIQDQKRPEGIVENFHAFRYAIKWTEPFIIGLVAFQVTIFVLSILVARKNQSFSARLGLMIFIGGVVRMAERLNKLGAQHWRSFCTQDYFDRQGVFLSVMLAAPLLLDVFLMLVFLVRESAQLLVTVKKAQIKQKYQQEKQQPNKKKRGKRDAKKDQ